MRGLLHFLLRQISDASLVVAAGLVEELLRLRILTELLEQAPLSDAGRHDLADARPVELAAAAARARRADGHVAVEAAERLRNSGSFLVGRALRQPIGGLARV